MTTETPLCECGKPRRLRRGKLKLDGTPYVRPRCASCERKRYPNHQNKRNKLPKGYKRRKKPACEECGFVAVHPCQLEIDHIDGNKKNNDPSNHRTVCANCHRLKTYSQKDWAHHLRPNDHPSRGCAPPVSV